MYRIYVCYIFAYFLQFLNFWYSYTLQFTTVYLYGSYGVNMCTHIQKTHVQSWLTLRTGRLVVDPIAVNAVHSLLEDERGDTVRVSGWGIETATNLLLATI